ncbi:MAG: DegV family protein [Oscillospiraceae bacterium]|nr:DegV family protein [Candidatus Equicaccousia limihippi]
MGKIIIASDSSCDLSPEIIERYDIKIVPFTVNMGEKSYKDGVDVFPDDLYKFEQESGTLPKTAAVNMAEAEEFFEKIRDDKSDPIIFFALSASMSGTYQYATAAAEELGNIYTVDSQNLSTGVGHLVIKAAELAKSGKTVDEILAVIEKMKPCVRASFVLDKLEYLHKGGRCSAVAAFGANLLKLKPMIGVRDGAMGVEKKYRGQYYEVLKQYTKDLLEGNDNVDLDRCIVTHSGVTPECLNDIVELVKTTLPFKEVLITRAGATISVHCGPNCLGVLFVEKY